MKVRARTTKADEDATLAILLSAHRALLRAQSPVSDHVAGATPTTDPVRAATAIVRRKANHDVDWSREPGSERERKIRARVLATILERPVPSIDIREVARGAVSDSWDDETWPQDLRNAYELADRALDERLEQRRLDQIDRAAQFIDVGEEDEEDDDE